MNDTKAINKLLPRAVALHQAGKLGEAAEAYQKAFNAAPKNPDVLRAFGLFQMHRGNWAEAERLMAASIKANPDQADLLSSLGHVLQQLDRNQEAVSCFDRAIKLQPDFEEAWRNRAGVMMKMERYDDAISALQQVIAIHALPADFVSLGIACEKLRRHEEALSSYERAIALDADNVVAHNNMGNILREQNRSEEALLCYSKAAALAPDFFLAYLNMGMALADLNRYDNALMALDKAIEVNPSFSRAYSSKGHYLIELGRLEEAEPVLARAVELNPDDVDAIAALLSVRPYQADDPRFKLLETLYAKRNSLPLDEQVRLYFAMGKALEKFKKYDEAFSAYEDGNRLYYKDHPHDEAAEIEVIERQRMLFSAEMLARYEALAATLPSSGDERVPIFIVGMPRSGTTLIEQILASHPALFGAGELLTLQNLANKAVIYKNDSPRWEANLPTLRQIGREYLEQVWKLAPHARYITDKMPENYTYLGMVHLMLPNARIIHALRNPMDSCFSCYALNFKSGHAYTHDMEALGRHYSRYRKLMEFWHEVLPPGRILDLRYEDMVADPEREARRLLDYLGLPWDPACLKFYETRREVKTASVTQVRQPIYSSSVARWKHFEKHLGPLQEIVGAFD